MQVIFTILFFLIYSLLYFIFKIVSRQKTWADADAYCRNELGTFLVAIETKEEDEMIERVHKTFGIVPFLFHRSFFSNCISTTNFKRYIEINIL